MAYLKIFPIKVTDKKALDYITNPDKTEEVTLILRQNAEKLIEYLSHFLPERGE